MKYSDANAEIRIYMEQDERGHQLLHIQDFGIGIKQEDLPRVFQKSYTGTVGREKTVSTGMGFGQTVNSNVPKLLFTVE